MSGYRRLVGVMILLSVSILTGCTTPPTTIQIHDMPVVLEGKRERDYTVSDAIAYAQYDDVVIGSMMIQEHDTERSDGQRDTYRKHSSYPQYAITKTKNITNKCDIPYTYTTATFVSDPVSEKHIYLTMIMIRKQGKTSIISYTTTDKSYRSQRLSDRKKTYGCTQS